MTCSGCARTVQAVLSRVEGVQAAEVDLEKQEAVVESAGPLPEEALRLALKNTPYSLKESVV